MQMAAYALGQSLPEEQRPFPMDKIQINDTRSDITPNAGGPLHSAAPGCSLDSGVQGAPTCSALIST